MIKTVLFLLAPLTSLSIVMLGNGMMTTILPLRLSKGGSSIEVAGWIYSTFAIGQVLGAFRTEAFITRVGHIRAYATFVSLQAVVVLLQAMFQDPTFWVISRVLAGLCLAGLYIVIESWLLCSASPEMRGRVLSLYMIAHYGFLSMGNWVLRFFDMYADRVFMAITMTACLSIIPVSMTKVGNPALSEPEVVGMRKLYKLSPTGFVGCLAAGIISGAAHALMPVYCVMQGFSATQTSEVMAITILGGMFLQYPIGKFSDIVGRPKTLIAVALATLASSASIVLTAQVDYRAFLFAAFLFGGMSFALYPLSINHTCDALSSTTSNILAATQGLLLANALGSAIGPTGSPYFMSWFGPNGLFLALGALSAYMAALFAWRHWAPGRGQRAGATVDFVALPPRTTPVVTEMDPRTDETPPVGEHGLTHSDDGTGGDRLSNDTPSSADDTSDDPPDDPRD